MRISWIAPQVACLLLVCLSPYCAFTGLTVSFRQQRVHFGINQQCLEIQSWFRGKYDNLKQAEADKLGKPDIKGYRHEYVTAEFYDHPLYTSSEQAIMTVKYYYGTNTSDVFRFRYYQFLEDSNGQGTIMKIFRPPKEWTFIPRVYDDSRTFPPVEFFEYLQGCDVRWMSSVDKISNKFYDGELVEGKCEVCSQFNASISLVIKDELKLWNNELWINDRVFTKDGKMIIGNIENIPYKLQRVS